MYIPIHTNDLWTARFYSMIGTINTPRYKFSPFFIGILSIYDSEDAVSQQGHLPANQNVSANTADTTTRSMSRQS